MKNHEQPRQRLKILRYEIGLTQQQLAARCGLSGSYIIAVENAQLSMSRSLAEAIAVATGIGPEWLLGNEGKTAEPLTPFGMRYTREYFRTVFDRKKWLRQDFDPDGDEAADINALCHEVSEVLRTAYAAGKLPLGLYFIKT